MATHLTGKKCSFVFLQNHAVSAIFLYTGSHFVPCEQAQAPRCQGEPVHRFSRKVSKNAHMIWLAKTQQNTSPEKKRWPSRQADTQAMDDAILSSVSRRKGDRERKK